MLPLKSISRYIEAVGLRMKRSQQERPWGSFPFVTISRQAGADGHELAQAVLSEIERRRVRAPDFFSDWQVFDEVLLRLLTEHPQVKASFSDLLSEHYRTRLQDTMHQILTGSPPQDLVLARVFHSLRGVAGLGKAIIVGRSGACLTRDLPKGVHVRLVAELSTRLASLSRQYGLNRAQALHEMRRIDAARAALVRDHFGRDIDDPLLYDAVWNIDAVPLGDIATWICQALENKVWPAAPEVSQAPGVDLARIGR